MHLLYIWKWERVHKRQRLWLRLGVNVDDQLWLRLNPIPIPNCNPSANPSPCRNTNPNPNLVENTDLVLILCANMMCYINKRSRLKAPYHINIHKLGWALVVMENFMKFSWRENFTEIFTLQFFKNFTV